MIQLSNLNLQFEATANSNAKTIINQLSVSISPGEIYVLVGENGTGKTSIINEIVRQNFLPQHESQVRLPDNFAYLAQDIWESPLIDPHNLDIDFYTIQYDYLSATTQQSGLGRSNFIYSLLPNSLISWYPLALSELDPQFNKKLQDYLFRFKLSPARLSHSYADLSPGTKKKLLLATLFASNPAAIMFDELTNHLDREMIDEVSEILRASQSAILLVDHNTEFVRNTANNWIYLPNNEDRIPYIFKDMNYDEFIAELERINTNVDSQLRVVRNKEKQLQKARELQTRRAEVFGVDLGAAMKHIDRRIEKEIINNKVHTQATKTFSVEFQTIKDLPTKIKKDRLVHAHNLIYKIGTAKIQTVESFKIFNGERIRIVGANGTGKSTLLKLIKEQILTQDITQNPQFVSGEIEINNELAKDELFVFSQVTAYADDLKIYEYLGRLLKIQDYQIQGFLKKISLDHYSTNGLLSSLSLGELIRLEFGVLAATLQSRKLILLDEPGNYLDILTQNTLIKLLNEFRGAVILVTHSDELAGRIGFNSEYEIGF